MRRRSFLCSAAAAVPVLGLHDLLAQAASAETPAPPAAALHEVGAGEDRFGSPHSLGFSSMAFKVGSQETAGNLFLVEHRNLTPGGPPLHLHLSQEEWFYVMEGEIAFQVGKQRIHLHPGESVLAPRRIPHTFSVVGATPGRMLIAFCPAGKMEQYFVDAPKPHPGVSDAEFFRRYEMEYIAPSPFQKSS
jgi:mannose-6-phosphate isomerase-like protein (cupin superfamily)